MATRKIFNKSRVERLTKSISSALLSLTLILALFTVLIPTPAKALSGINGTAPWTFDITTNTLTISAGTLNPRTAIWSNDFTGVLNNQIQTVIIEPGVIAPANMSNFFGSWWSLIEVQGTYNLDVSNVTDMSWMFTWTPSLTTLDVSNWDVSNVTDMSWMFDSTPSLTTLDLSNWDVSNVTDMSHMFNSSSSLTTLDLSNWDTSNVTNMNWMFGWASSLTTLDVSNWDTSSVTNMGSMFSGASSLTTLDVSNWDTSGVTNMEGVFQSTTSLTSLDLSNWDVSNVTSMSVMFNASSLTTLDLSNWDTSNVTDMISMFSGASSLTTLDVSNWDTSNVTNMDGMFAWASSLTTLDVSNWDVSNVGNMNAMFWNTPSLTTLDVSNWDMSSVLDTSWMFFDTPSLQELRLGKDFIFNAPWNWSTAQLPEANSFNSNPAIYTGLWCNMRTGWTGTAAELMSTYHGPTMHGTYVWERVGGIGTGVCGHPLVSYNITYLANSPSPELTVINVPNNESQVAGTVVQISNTIPQLQGYIFTGWRNITTGQILQPGTTITLNSNITLEAQWTPANITPPIDPPITITPPSSGVSFLNNRR